MNGKSRAGRKNSIALPGIDTAAEVELINQGYAERLPDNRYRINGRPYIDKGDGYTFPATGEGIVEITNAQFRALRLLIEHDGRTVDVDQVFRHDPRLSVEDVAIAVELFSFKTRKS
jgi:hypothetical protein